MVIISFNFLSLFWGAIFFFPPFVSGFPNTTKPTKPTKPNTTTMATEAEELVGFLRDSNAQIAMQALDLVCFSCF